MDSRNQRVYLQPTPFCNIACDYCYLDARNNVARMDITTLELVFRQVLATRYLADPVQFVWHAGEPLVVGVDFYRTAWALASRIAKEYGRTFSFGVQTNGTLIDESWCRLFHELPMLVGVSLDGPAFIHDAHRVSRSGRGTHSKVLEGVRTLQSNRIPFTVISVLSRRSIKHPDAIFDFFVDNRIEE